ncbi:MAG: prolyl-tRNA synthetase associated domain-containing protein [Clostridia bacterium]|nr:prolyl-tRNA synthetase associated domain-containing protein [Clostridia bacterium]
MELQQGRPQCCEGREARESRTYDFLDKLGISYDRVDHPRAETMEDCRRIEEVLKAPICKNLLLCNRQGTVFYLLLMPGDKPFRTKELSAQIQSARLSFASAERMVEFLDIHPGALSVMGLMNDTEHQVQLLIDEDVLANEWFGCHPCVNTSTLRMKTEDVTKVFLPAVKHDWRVVHLVGEEPS